MVSDLSTVDVILLHKYRFSMTENLHLGLKYLLGVTGYIIHIVKIILLINSILVENAL